MLAKTYGVLPSKVLAEGTTFDLMVYDIMITWEREQQDRAEGKKPKPNLSQRQMMDMIAKARADNGRNQ